MSMIILNKTKFLESYITKIWIPVHFRYKAGRFYNIPFQKYRTGGDGQKGDALNM